MLCNTQKEHRQAGLVRPERDEIPLSSLPPSIQSGRRRPYASMALRLMCQSTRCAEKATGGGGRRALHRSSRGLS